MANKEKVKSLRVDYPQEIPLIERVMLAMPIVQRAQNKLECQAKALIKYHKTCARAANTLIEDLSKCS